MPTTLRGDNLSFAEREGTRTENDLRPDSIRRDTDDSIRAPLNQVGVVHEITSKPLAASSAHPTQTVASHPSEGSSTSHHALTQPPQAQHSRPVTQSSMPGRSTRWPLFVVSHTFGLPLLRRCFRPRRLFRRCCLTPLQTEATGEYSKAISGPISKSLP